MMRSGVSAPATRAVPAKEMRATRTRRFLKWIAAATLASLGPLPAQAQNPFGTQNVAYIEVRGVVREAHTSAPIAGARVLALWSGTTQSMSGSTRHCLRIDATRSGADGSFSMNAPVDTVFRGGLAQPYVELRIYRAGLIEHPSDQDEHGRSLSVREERRLYGAALLQGGMLQAVHLTVQAQLYPTTQDAPDRLRYLQQLSDVESYCETLGDAASLSAYLQAIADEAQQIAHTDYQRMLALAIQARATRSFGLESVEPSSPAIPAELLIMDRAYQAPDLTDLERRDRDQRTPLMIAARSGDVAEVSRLLAQGARPNRTRSVNELLSDDSALTAAMAAYAGPATGHTPAVRDAYLGTIKALLAAPGSNPDLRDQPSAYTPLMKALEWGEDEIVALLLQAGADPNLTAYGGQYSALGIATTRALSGQSSAGAPLPGAQRQLQLLAASPRINLNAIQNYWGDTALIRALQMGNAAVGQTLLSAGADPNAQDRLQRTPLLAATEAAILNPARPGYLQTLRLISGWPGTRPDALYHGQTALQMCREHQRADLEQILNRSGH
jgi:ankyrin repeat protein